VRDAGIRITDSIKFAGILHESETRIMPAATTINPNPIVVITVAYCSLRKSTSIDDIANGIIRTPPEIATAIYPCSGEMPRPKEHLSASIEKRLEATDWDAMAKNMKMPEIMAAFAPRRA
jgi:hypothetical protein